MNYFTTDFYTQKLNHCPWYSQKPIFGKIAEFFSDFSFLVTILIYCSKQKPSGDNHIDNVWLLRLKHIVEFLRICFSRPWRVASVIIPTGSKYVLDDYFYKVKGAKQSAMFRNINFRKNIKNFKKKVRFELFQAITQSRLKMFKIQFALHYCQNNSLLYKSTCTICIYFTCIIQFVAGFWTAKTRQSRIFIITWGERTTNIVK